MAGQDSKHMFHQRKSIRLANYDYSTPNAYFVTSCCQNRQHLFGQVVNGKMVLNDYGEIVNYYWDKIEQHFLLVTIEADVVMPNHVHGIVIIHDEHYAEFLNEEKNRCGRFSRPVPRILLDNDDGINDCSEQGDCFVGGGKNPSRQLGVETSPRQLGVETSSRQLGEKTSPLRVRQLDAEKPFMQPGDLPSRIKKPTLGQIMGYFKYQTTKQMNKIVGFAGRKIWQRSFYDHIIRNDQALQKIRNYITNNPTKWQKDVENQAFRNFITEHDRDAYYKQLNA